VIYACCDELRREAVRRHPTLNGIDFLDVVDHDLSAANPLRQRTLLVTLLKPVPATYDATYVQLSGGERIRGIGIAWAMVATAVPPAPADPDELEVALIIAALPDLTRVLVVRTTTAGDFSPYTLNLVDHALPPLIDPQLDEIVFSFKVECPTDFDCRPAPACSPPDAPATDIDYLAKDYASFRRVALERLATLAPAWQQSSVADTGIALVELLAYVGDQLSYEQDAIATEAYLGTARRRVSLRRHAQMVDYPMHDGCNARAWVQLQVSADVVLDQAGTQFLSRCTATDVALAPGSTKLRDAMLQSPLVFEPLHGASLHVAHNRILFYTWSDARCCLAKGATTATLDGHYPDLHQWDALLFEEVLGPDTGQPGDADATHRHIVRLISEPVQGSDPYDGHLITSIVWAAGDALPFPLCISAVLTSGGSALPLDGITVARGNLVLADHGQSLPAEALGRVPAPTLTLVGACADRCNPADPQLVPVRFNPQLAQGPLTQAARVAAGGGLAPFDPQAAAAAALDWSMSQVLPQLTLTDDANQPWHAQRTLLGSDGAASDVVVEVDDEGLAELRFGDDQHGRRPLAGTAFSASYRIGNGAVGNLGSDTLQHVVCAPIALGAIASLGNPLPGAGGVDAESSDSVRRNAPEAFRTQERAVTTDDYAAVSERFDGVRRAAASLRWTGSWYTAFITVEPQSGQDQAALDAGLGPFIERYRMAGQDVAFDQPRYVSLELELHVCVLADSFRSDVKAGLLDALSNRDLGDGRLGLFNQGNFSFGQTVYLSPIYAAAHAVPGVSSVLITVFDRQGGTDPTALASGELPLGRLEIARLDNDANYPEHGVLRLDIQGGK
jgi:hypothetical protein